MKIVKDAYKVVKKLYDHVTRKIVMHTFLKTIEDEMKSIINKHEKKIKSLDKNERDRIVFDFPVHLFKIHDVLVGTVAETYGFKHTFRSVHDRFFDLFGIKNPDRRFAHIATDIFTRFIQGITYFRMDQDEQARPIYHRDRFVTNKHKMTNEEIRAFLKTCYLERLIYNDIYTNTFHRQNLGHMVELQNVERMYQNTFPGELLVIRITYMDDIFPVKLVIIHKDMQDKTTTEEYVHIKNGGVACVKTTWDRKRFEKFQTFDQEQPWIQSS